MDAGMHAEMDECFERLPVTSCLTVTSRLVDAHLYRDKLKEHVAAIPIKLCDEELDIPVNAGASTPATRTNELRTF